MTANLCQLEFLFFKNKTVFMFSLGLHDLRKNLLRQTDSSELSQFLFSFFLFFQELHSPGSIATVELGGDVLADGCFRLSGNNLASDCRLYGNGEELFG